MSATAYPLTWPRQFARAQAREKGQFKTTLVGALKNVETSLRMFSRDSDTELENLVISSNVTLGVQRPEDPGVAVWFTWAGMCVCIAVDRYASVEANLQAIHHIIEARRVELRHGTLALVRATFTGFKALPAPAGKQWWQVLGVKADATADQIRAAHKALASKNHSDHGGNDARMAEINVARDEGLRK
jgi:hypothetical protein